VRQASAPISLDENRPLTERIAALAPLSFAPPAELAPLRELLEARHPIDLQLAAVAVLAAVDDSETLPALFKAWPTYSPRVQSAILSSSKIGDRLRSLT
jgi:hypothetical protein